MAMTTFPGSPRFLKGALVGVDLLDPNPSVIVFQYNPETLTRSLKARAMSGEGATSEATRLTGAPEETIQVEVRIDATDQLENGNDPAVSMGIYPQLSAIEMLIYPNSNVVIANTAIMALGTIEVVPPEGPFTLFIWGAKRILPVRVTECSVTEEQFAADLSPIRAKVSLGLRVLSYNDLPLTHPGYHMFLSHQIVKETMANVGSANDLTAVAGANVKLF
jgi:hypothetical protein